MSDSWFIRARVRILKDYDSASPELRLRPCEFRVGQERVLLQWGWNDRPPDHGAWWTSFDIDLAGIIPADYVEVIEILEQRLHPDEAGGQS
jgi:hypothetical protein